MAEVLAMVNGIIGWMARLGRACGGGEGPARDGAPGKPVESLVTDLKSGSLPARRAAARALGEAGDERAVEPMIEALQESRDFRLKEDVITALGKLGDPRAVDPLIAKLKDRGEDFYLRKKAAYTLYAIYRQGRLDEEAREKVLSLWHSWYLL
jgi:hypothetical protein